MISSRELESPQPQEWRNIVKLGCKVDESNSLETVQAFLKDPEGFIAEEQALDAQNGGLIEKAAREEARRRSFTIHHFDEQSYKTGMYILRNAMGRQRQAEEKPEVEVSSSGFDALQVAKMKMFDTPDAMFSAQQQVLKRTISPFFEPGKLRPTAVYAMWEGVKDYNYMVHATARSGRP